MATVKHIEWLFEGVPSWNARREQHQFTPDLRDEDLCDIFRREGKLSESGRMPLTDINLRNADLRGARLSCSHSGIGPDLTSANLSWADFESAILPNSILDAANLHGTNFRGAKLHNASLLGVNIAGTILVGADLSQADLTGVTMNLVSLANADLNHATLVDTDLTQASLVGADLSCSHPWTAKLYPRDRDSDRVQQGSGSQKPVNTVQELLGKTREIGQGHEKRAVYFRGEPSDRFALRPSVMRESQEDRFAFRTNESDMLIHLVTQRPEDFSNITSALSHWVLAQHHGLKTRLLDITRNPLVGLFWACQPSECNRCAKNQCDTTKCAKHRPGRVHIFSVPRDLIKPFNSSTIGIIANFARLSSADKNLLLGWTLEEAAARDPDSPMEYIYEHAMQRLYQRVSLEKPYFEERIDPRDLYRVFVVEPMQSFERIRAQSGAFLVSAFHERFERSRILQWNPDIPIYDHDVYLVPSEKKQDILDELRLLNITRETLLPGLDEAAKAIARFFS